MAPFSYEVFGEILAQWRDMQNGIPPTREMKGRGGQNPRLLKAFDALARAQARAKDYFQKKEAKKRR